jgi:hypothetical protein
MDLSERIEAFSGLGDYLKESLQEIDHTTALSVTGKAGNEDGSAGFFADRGLAAAAGKAEEENPWFIPGFIHHALSETARLLSKENLEKWVSAYPEKKFRPGRPLSVGTILAGNIPLVGFHDFLSILISGHGFIGKTSGKDSRLLPFLADRLLELESRFTPLLRFEESRLGPVDAIIATGSNNSFRYFEYYFGKYPHIFRQNRNGVAILGGNESAEELSALADDIFLYFGLGCRNVAKLYVPEGYSFDDLFREIERYLPLAGHNKYANNYLYQRSVLLMNRVEHLDNGFLLIRAGEAVSSPVGTLHYEPYKDRTELAASLPGIGDSIQCIAGPGIPGLSTLKFGSTQHPELWDYADNMDTLKFLTNLYEN